MSIHSIKIQKTARYAIFGEPSEATEQVWFVCHGYGQLAEYFIKKFEHLDAQKHYVVAPEALSKFYLDGFSGRVGATWMTKENRLAEIEDYVNFLNELYEKVFQNTSLNPEQLQVNLLGFSQGTATVMRWAFAGKVRFERVLLCSGGLAHDLDMSKKDKILADKSLYFIYGTQDKLINQAQFQKQLDMIHQLKLNVQIISFEGGHEIHGETITMIAAQ